MRLPPGTRLTLGMIAEFYKMSVQQLILWSTAAMCPDDLLGTPTCNCLFVQPDSWMYTGQDITSERKDTSAFACSARSQRHQRQRLLTYVCTCETAAQAQTLGLWGWAGQLSSDTSQWTTTLLFGWCSSMPRCAS